VVHINVFGPVCALGEGPLWDPAEQQLYWIDSAGKAIYRAAADGSGLVRWAAPGEVGALALREQGGAIVTVDRSVYFLDFPSGRFELVADLERHLPSNRMNDGKVDRDGRFVFGSFDTEIFAAAEPRAPRASLYCIEADLRPRKVLGRIGCSNGPCWSPDGATFYFSDTATHAIAAYPWDRATATVGDPREFTRPDPLVFPDGATVDAAGYLWSTACRASEIRRYAPDGTLDRVVRLPIDRPTSVAFGGPSLDILFVTSMSIRSGGGANAGRVHAVSGLGVTGLAEPRFRG